MDHLPRIRDTAFQFPDVFLYKDARISYQRPFDSFSRSVPSQAGSRQDWQNTYTCFVQEWLFFGLLEELFCLFELPYDRNDFVKQKDGRDVITTERLNDYFVAAIVQEHMKNQPGEGHVKGVSLNEKDGWKAFNSTGLLEGPQLDRIRDWLRKAHGLLVTARNILRNDIKPNLEYVDGAVWDSILLTIAALSRVIDVLYRRVGYNYEEWFYPIDFREFHFLNVQDMRLNENWCLHERKLIEELVDGRLQEIAFFSQLDRGEAKGLHSNCTKQECIAYQVTQGYLTRHVDPNCDCEMVGIVYDVDEMVASEQHEEAKQSESDNTGKWFGAGKVVNALQNIYAELSKEVPALTFRDGSIQTVKVPLVKSKASAWMGTPLRGWNLVAISHVWSDGLGNPVKNELPTCQLSRLQSLVNALYEENQQPIPFWIDTLMIPTIPPEPTEKQKAMKTQALRDMEWIYKGASKVLVLDSGLFSQDSTNMSAEELGARIMCTSWSRRLWTLQEGCIQDRTYFQFRNRTMSWPDLHKNVLERTSISDWRTKHTTLPKKHPVRKKQKIPTWKYNGTHTKINIGDPLNSTTKIDISRPLAQAKDHLDNQLFKAVNPVWYTIHSFLEDMSLDWSDSGLKGEALARCMRGVYYRNCTKKEDEGLVLTSLLSSKPGSAAAIAKSKKEDRLKDLFNQLTDVPVEVLFIDQERYIDQGSRWIPKTMLSVNAPSSRPIHRSERLQKRSMVASRKANVICKHVEGGIEIGLDGLRIHPSPRALSAPFRFEHQNAYFRVDLRQPGTASEITSCEEGKWVLIPEVMFATKSLECQAVLVKVLNWYPNRPGGETQFSALAILTLMTPEDWSASSLPEVEVRLYEKQKLNSRQAWKDFGNTMKKFAQDSTHKNDKWIVG